MASETLPKIKNFYASVLTHNSMLKFGILLRYNLIKETYIWLYFNKKAYLDRIYFYNYLKFPALKVNSIFLVFKASHVKRWEKQFPKYCYVRMKRNVFMVDRRFSTTYLPSTHLNFQSIFILLKFLFEFWILTCVNIF